MSDFTPLPIADGVGDYHFNRFRVAFDASRLADSFGTYLKSGAASVNTSTGKTHEGKRTFEFTGNAKVRDIDHWITDYMIPDFAHTDWVYVHDTGNNGFTAQTLKRNFRTQAETAASTAAYRISMAAGLAVDGAIDINQRHFLAGRRAWRLDRGAVFGYTGDIRVLETVAIERFSHTAYHYSGAGIGDIEVMVRRVWLNMLRNYITINGYQTISTPPGTISGWKAEGDYHYLQLSFRDGGLHSSHPWDFRALYPHVVPS